MRESVQARQQLRDSINEEIGARVKAHQSKMARIKTGRANLLAAGGPPARAPLAMLAHGDSWFDYPLTGNGLPIANTDIVAQLETMGNVNPVILNMSHYGDATTDEMSRPKQQRMIESLQDRTNWFEAGKHHSLEGAHLAAI